MTESEAKGFIQGKLDCMNKCDIFNKEDNTSDNDCDNCKYCYSQGNFGEQKEAFQMSINAIEEVERYRNIGVVSSYEMEQDLLLYKADREILNGYQELGTVEELKLAKEKQIAKKIEIRKATNDDIESELRDFITVKGRICRCPSCRCCIHISELKYCWECGQKLDWSDEE